MTNGHPFDKTDLLSYFTGAGSEEKRRTVSAHVASCESCRRYLNDLESEKSTFLATHPFETTIALPSRPDSGRMLRFSRYQQYALAATLVLCIAGAAYLYRPAGTGSEIRIKGETGLKAFVQTRAGVIENRKGRVYFTGEKIQFLYSCGEKNRFMLLDMDTAGAITIFYPATGDSSVAVERGADMPLPNSITLDEYTGSEVFFAVFSKRPLYVPDVKARCAAAFARTRSLDSIDFKEDGVTAVSYHVTVRPGGRP
jgi:hypothetical protein